MKYRQWKKNYKKRYGVNPPASIDKRKRRKAAAGQQTDYNDGFMNIPDGVDDELPFN